MNRLRCFLLATIVVLSSATFALGGVIQGPGKSDPIPTSTLTTGLTQPTSTEEIQIVWQDATTMLVAILLTTF